MKYLIEDEEKIGFPFIIHFHKKYQAVKKIFFEHHSQIYAEVNDNITKDMYYNIMNKMIYLTALEFELI